MNFNKPGDVLFKNKMVSLFTKPALGSSPISLAEVLEHTKKRIKPLFKNYVWTNVGKTGLAGGVLGAISILCFYLQLGIEQFNFLKIILQLGSIVTLVSSILSLILVIHMPLDFLKFNENRPFSLFRGRDSTKFKLTTQEVQSLLASNLNEQQKKFILETVKTQGYINYINLLEAKEMESDFSEYLIEKGHRETLLKSFIEENELISLESDSTEKEWGETTSLKKWL